MTRNQIELLCRNIQASTGDWKPEESILLKHDAEQRQVIEQQQKTIKILECEVSAQRARNYELRLIVEHSRRTVAHWEAELMTGNKKIEHQAQQIATLREGVDSLVKWLCGEEGNFGSEPEPLVGKYRRAFWWRAELRKRYEAIKQALKEVKL